MTPTLETVAPDDIERVAALVGQMFKSLESRREYMRNLRIEVPALESAWSAIARNVLTLGRRRRTIEASLPPLPEPRGATATQNWMEQRRAQGSRAQAWIERLPAALALLRSVEPIEGFGHSYTFPDADEQRAEGLRDQMRQAIIRQEPSSMDSLLLQIQASLMRAGQRRMDLTRIVESRVADVLPALEALALRDATGVPELQRWQGAVRTSVGTIMDAVCRWDVVAAREGESSLNALADEVPRIRKRIESELREMAATTAAREMTNGQRTARHTELGSYLDVRNLFWRSMRAGGTVTVALGVVGALVGLSVVAVVFALNLATLSSLSGLMTLATPIILAVAGACVGAAVGMLRLRTRRRAAADESASLDRQIAIDAHTLSDLHNRQENLRSTLAWFQI